MRKPKAAIGWAVLCCIAAWGSWSCRRPVPRHITPAYYYWKARLELDSATRAALGAQPGTRLYLRFFDVAWDAAAARPAPVAPLVVAGTLPADIDYVPVVFLANRMLTRCSPAAVAPLASHILSKIRAMAPSVGGSYRAVQLDCDWTAATRALYFRLLDTLCSRLHAEGRSLSVTIRLHQVKYAATTGVPPADRGMLMMYNMGNWKSPATRNSLYDPDVAARYLSRLAGYPLPLDVALPILRWSIVYRGGNFLTFLNLVTSDTLQKVSFLKRLEDPNRFVVEADSFAFGCGLRRGDLIRSETCSFRELMKGRKMLLEKLRNHNLTLALFHLDGPLLKHFTHAQMQEIFSSVQ